MVKVMEGFRVLEVAQFTFVPAAGAILADWGADVIKVEHPVRGDTQRGFINMAGFELDAQRHPLIEHPNRGKRSVGIDVSKPGGQEVLYELARTADVFLTNYMPAVRQKNNFDVEHIRARQPEYRLCTRLGVRDKGPERDVGGYDGTAFWTRSGMATRCRPPNSVVPGQGFRRSETPSAACSSPAASRPRSCIDERTGEALEVDVSLLSTAWWAAGASMTQGMETGESMRAAMPHSGGSAAIRSWATTKPQTAARSTCAS